MSNSTNASETAEADAGHQLQVNPLTELLFSEGFEGTALDPAFWTLTGTNTWRTVLDKTRGAAAGVGQLLMDSSVDDSYSRNEATLTLDLSGKQDLQLKFAATIYSDEPDGPPASPFLGGANFDGVAISADGNTWYEVQPLRTLTTGVWQSFTVDLDAALAAHGLSYTSAFRIRFNHYDNYTAPTDGIGIDSVSIVHTVVRALTLNLPATLDENAEPAIGSVQALPAPAADLTVTLISGQPSGLSVPVIVTIPAGQTSASFLITPVNDDLLNGTRPISVAASAPAYAPASATVALQDDETTVLSITLPSVGTEGAAALAGTLSVATAPAVDVAVQLTSSLPGRALPPATVTIPARQTSVPFALALPNNNKLDGPALVTITAAVANWTAGSASVLVQDDDIPALTLLLPAGVREGDTGRTGTVQLSGTLEVPLTVSLLSADPAMATVPATITVPAGTLTASFPLTIVDDALLNGAHTVRIDAAATNFISGSAVLSIADNDVDHFTVAPIAGVIRGAPSVVIVTAQDVNGATITNYQGTPALTAAGALGSQSVTPALTGAFVNGVWTGSLVFSALDTGVVLTVTDAGGRFGASNAFTVGVGPLHHFGWSTVASPQTVDTPFAATLTALDAGGNAAAFTGTASLGVVKPVATVTTGTSSSISVPPFNTRFADARLQCLFKAAEVGTARTLTGFQVNVAIAGGAPMSNFTVRLKSTALSSTLAWEGSGWTVVYQGTLPAPTATGWLPLQFSTPFPYDGTSNLLVDFSFNNAAASTASPAQVYASVVSGFPAIVGGDNHLTGDPLTWTGTTGGALSQSPYRPDLQWLASGLPIPLRPATAAGFVNGVWSGPVSVPVTASGARLQASESGGAAGTSNAFDVASSSLTTGTGAVFSENFESGVLVPAWTLTGTSTWQTLVTSANGPHGGTYHLTMDSSDASATSYERNEATLSINLAGRTGVKLAFWAKMFDDEGDGPPSSPFIGGANFDGVAISADGNTWWEVQSLRSPTVANTWGQFTVDLDAAAAAHGLTYNSSFRIRFNHYDNYPIATDGIAIDDIVITADSLNTGTGLSLPATVTEGAGAIAGTVTLPSAPASAVTVTLVSGAPAKLSVPPSVTVPAGQTSVAFTATVPDDSILDGDRTVVVQASATGYTTSAQAVLVRDNDTATVSLTLPASVSESAGAVSGRLDLGGVAATDLLFNLTSSDASAATVPATVTVPAGSSSAVVSVTIVDDTKINGLHSVTITAARTGWTAATRTVSIVDNESTALTLAVPTPAVEASTASGTVFIAGTLTSPLTVGLLSSDTSRMSVPASVTIAAGQTSVAFLITYPDDHVVLGSQNVALTATAPGFTSASKTFPITDNDPDHFTFAPVADPQVRNGPVALTVTACDAAGLPVTAFAGPATITASTGTVTPSTLTGWVNGVWSGTVRLSTLASGVTLSVNDGWGHVGVSNAFTVALGAMDHFSWDALPASQTVDTPFAVTVRAMDAGENPITGYSGFATLSALMPVPGTAPATSTTSNYPLVTISPSARMQSIYPPALVGKAGPLVALALNVSSLPPVPLTNWTLRLKHTTQTAFSSALWDNAGWTTVHVSSASLSATGWATFQFQTPFDYDGVSNLLVDYSFRNPAAGGSSASVWSHYGSGYVSVTGTSSTVGSDPLAWANDATNTRNVYSYAPDVIFSTGTAVPLRTAAPATFVNGVWSGSVSLAAPGAGVLLKARDASGHAGRSGLFTSAAAAPAAPSGTLFAEGWETGLFSSAWTITGTGSYRTQITTANSPHGGTSQLTMDSSSYYSYGRNEATLSLNLTGQIGVTLRFWAKGFSEVPDGPPSSPFTTGANFDGVAISADGVTWWEVQPLRTLTSAWQQYTVNLDAAAASHGLTYNSSFRIRFNQYGQYYIPYAGIAIDDISVTSIPGFSFALPSQVNETAGTASGTVSLAAVRGVATVVALSSSAPAKIAVPASVTIPAGQLSATFQLTVLDDNLADGNKTVTLTASSPGLNVSTGSLLVLDNDTGSLSLSLPATTSESASAFTGTLLLSVTPSAPLTVNLSSSDPTAASVPATVTVLPGQTSVPFTVTPVDDSKIDGPQTTIITASLAGWSSASTSLVVTDNETSTLTVYSASLYEGTTSTMSLYLSGTLATPLTVSLVSANPARLTVPVSVTIPAGQTSASFVITAVENSAMDGLQTVQVSASAAGFTAGSGSVSIYDNDVHHLQFGYIAATQIANVPFTVSVSAMSVDGYSISWNGMVTLSAATGATSLPVTPTALALLSGSGSASVNIAAQATGVILKADDGAGHTGLSTSFTTGVGALDHFAFDPVGSAQTALAPFGVTITAKDAGNNTVTGFTGTAALSVGVRATGTGTSSSGYPLYTYYHDCRTQTLYTPAELGGAGRFTTLALNVSKIPGQTMNNWTIRMKTTALTAFPATGAVWESTGWTVVHQSNATISSVGWVTFPLTTPFDYDGVSSLIIDFSFNNSSYTSEGYVAATTMSSNRMLYAYTDSGYGDPLVWSGSSSPSPYVSTALPNLRLGQASALTLTPATTGAFVAGVWSGNATVSGPGTGLALQAVSGSALGTSNSFNVVAGAALTVTPADGLTSTGPRGGSSFSPAQQTWTLKNTGAATLSWSAGNSASWLTLSATSGTLAPNATATVTGTINATASTLTAGTWQDTVTFSNLTNGAGDTTKPVSLTVMAAGRLDVSLPASAAFSTSYGTSFAPATQAWTLTNGGDATLIWQIPSVAAFLSASSTGGTLTPGQSTTVSVGPVAGWANNGLSYSTATLAFNNATTGVGNTTRAVTVSVAPPVPTLGALAPATPSTTVPLTWNAVIGATGYEVQASADPQFSTVRTSGPKGGTSYGFIGLGEGQWYFRVASRYYANGVNLVVSPWSSSVSTRTDITSPALAVTSPGTWSLSLYTLAGTASDLSGVSSLLVNGVPAITTDGFAHWSLPVTLGPGVNTFIVVARDGATPPNVTSLSKQITMAFVSTAGDGLPDDWKNRYGLTLASGAMSDPDGDGVPNLIEYALALNPRTFDSSAPIPLGPQTDPGNCLKYLTWQYRRGLNRLGVTVVPEVSNNLANWRSDAASLETVGFPVLNGDLESETVTVRALPALDATAPVPLYFRVRVQALP